MATPSGRRGTTAGRHRQPSGSVRAPAAGAGEGALGGSRWPRREELCSSRLGRPGPARPERRVWAITSGGTSKVLLGVEPEDLLGRGHLGGAERGPVGLAGVLGGRRGPRDDRAQPDQAGPVGHLARGLRARRTAPARPRGSPRSRGSSRRAARASRRPRTAPPTSSVNATWVSSSMRDLVVVVDAGSGCRARWCPAIDDASAADALLQVAVAAEGVDVVVEEGLARRGVGVEQTALPTRGHRHADGVGDALTERPGGGLDARGVPVLGVTGSQPSPRCAAP